MRGLYNAPKPRIWLEVNAFWSVECFGVCSGLPLTTLFCPYVALQRMLEHLILISQPVTPKSNSLSTDRKVLAERASVEAEDLGGCEHSPSSESDRPASVSQRPAQHCCIVKAPLLPSRSKGTTSKTKAIRRCLSRQGGSVRAADSQTRTCLGPPTCLPVGSEAIPGASSLLRDSRA